MKAQMMISVIAMITLMIFQTTEADQKLIEKTCRKTPDYNLCMGLIHGDEDVDEAGIGWTMITVIKQKSEEALSIINKYSGQRKALKRCSDVYEAALNSDIPTALLSIWQSPRFAETAVVNTEAKVNICDKSLGGKLPELSGVNKYIARVAQVAIAIIKNLR